MGMVVDELVNVWVGFLGEPKQECTSAKQMADLFLFYLPKLATSSGRLPALPGQAIMA